MYWQLSIWPFEKQKHENHYYTKQTFDEIFTVEIKYTSTYIFYFRLFFMLSYLNVRKEIVLEIHAGNSSPFCVVMLNSKRYLMLLLYSPYYYTQSVIYFWQTFCQFGHLWMIISAVYRDFHEKKIEFSSSSSSALPFAIDIFSTIKQKISQKKILNHELMDYYLWYR